MSDPTAKLAKIEAAVGLGLMTTPGWTAWLQTFSVAMSALAAACGAVVGIHAVWQLRKRRKGRPSGE